MVVKDSIYVGTSSGGPWLKAPGRIGSSAIKGAGFDIDIDETDGIAVMATGHGENIMYNNTSGQACRKIKKQGYLGDTKSFLTKNGFDFSQEGVYWDLGLFTVNFDFEKQKGNVGMIQTSPAIIYGAISSKWPDKIMVKYSIKKESSKYLEAGFSFTLI